MLNLPNVRWGILGCGDVAEKKGGPALQQAAGAELGAVMRRDRAKAEDFARRHHAGRAYDDADQLLADPEIDAVYIATPPDSHAALTCRAAAAGKRVLVEKPMARTLAECDQMIAACRAANVSLHVAYYRRFWPKFVAAKSLIQSGILGKPLGARLLLTTQSGAAGWRTDPEISGGGHFVDVGSHRIDMLLHLLGDVAEISGFAENNIGHHAAENDVALALRLKSGALVSGGFHFHAARRHDVLEIYGGDGTLTLDPFDGETLVLRAMNGDETVHRFETPSPTHLPFVENLIRVYHGEKLAHVTGEEGRKTTRIIEAALSTPRK